ncbi:uncharacterized protein LOC142228062 [Haematobia irritans]|uniref:uncharacterized protein LOC142228062 n=1 Tax=Haematobia irritans TaxID=7368 RepID=UPI003F502843
MADNDSNGIKNCKNAKEEDLKIPKHNKPCIPTQKIKPGKKKRRNKSDLGDDFVAPDGGWGWIVALASGLNGLVAYAAAQQFGIIFKGYMTELEISSSQLTTIINTQIAISEVAGLINGPIFRRFSFRQVGLMGSVLQFAGLFACAYASSFQFFMFSYSWCYGIGRSLVISASAMAVNTYFKKKRRAATSYQFGVSGLGPIVMPFLATYLLDSVGVRYTILCFAALTLNTFAGSLVFQPAEWHVNKEKKDAKVLEKLNGSNGVSVEVSNTQKQSININCAKKDLHDSEMQNMNDSIKENDRDYSLRLITKEQKYKSYQGVATNGTSGEKLRASRDSKCRNLFKLWMSKIVKFFDLDLLCDFTYLNLIIGLTLINFVVLTPFILSDFGFDLNQIALAMSLSGICDLILRFLIPVTAAKMKVSNMLFFAAGLLGMCIGRFFLSFPISFYIMIAIFLWLGFSKAFRTVFWALIIPGYVPLKKLPGATGIQRVMAAIFSMACGPLIGIIRDKFSYAVVLNFLNVLCLVALFMWLVEYLICRHKNKPAFENEDCK